MSENSTIQSRSQRSSTNDSSKMETSPYSVLTMSQVCTMLLALMSLMISIHVMNLMDAFRKRLSKATLILDILKERAETGRLYIMNIDHCNSHSSFIDKVNMSNLCQEITLPTDPIGHIDDASGEIALCVLSAVNVGKLKNLDELEELCDLSVRGLEELIDYQDYPVVAAELATKHVVLLVLDLLDLHTSLRRTVLSMTLKSLGIEFMN